MSPRRRSRNKNRGPEAPHGARFEFRDRTGKVHGHGKTEKPARERPTAAPLGGGEGKRRERPSKPAGKRGEGFKRRRSAANARRGEAELKATIDKNHKGFGFLIFEDRSYEDAFIPPREAQALFHGDRVRVKIDSRGEIAGIEVLEHRFRELVGRFMPHPSGPKRGGWVIYERKRAREEVFAPKGAEGARAADWVRAKLHFHESGPFPVTAEITEIYGPELPASADIGMVAAEYNLIEEHSKAAVREAGELRLEIPGRDLDGRRDLRGVPFITIDGETARDFDDAVFVERRESGYILWVAIADVSHYVTEGGALDQEARSRGTSVYFPERAFHMLPRALSENLCSLKPREPRLALVARMECDGGGRRADTQVLEAVIQSHRRATYEQIQAEWETNRHHKHWEYAPHFELYALIRKLRAARGSIDFDLPEAELRVDPQGEVISIQRRSRLDSHRLIEEFMIAANEAVTDWMMRRNWPFVYRVHEEPAQQSLLKFQKLAANAGVHFAFKPSGGAATSPKVMAEVVRRLEGHPAQALLNMALLRSMKQAVYSSTHGIHYGLASAGYTHFTSPIRRYPDLVVHRLLRMALRTEARKEPALKKRDRDRLERELAEVCEHCSYRERLASDAERESIKLKQVRAMTGQLGNEFEGSVVGMTDSGLFVQIPEPYCDGLVNKDTMTDDFYEYDEDRMIFLGRRRKRVFRIGDKLRVRALRADIDRRQIDFGLAADHKR